MVVHTASLHPPAKRLCNPSIFPSPPDTATAESWEHDLRQLAEQLPSRAISRPRPKGEHPPPNASLLELHRDTTGPHWRKPSRSRHFPAVGKDDELLRGHTWRRVSFFAPTYPSSAASSPTRKLSSGCARVPTTSAVSTRLGGVAGRVVAAGRHGQVQAAGFFFGPRRTGITYLVRMNWRRASRLAEWCRQQSA